MFFKEIIFIILFIAFNKFSAIPQNSVSYNWKNVQIVGGGFVSGIVFHPAEKGLRYCRTDMGGAYRWNDQVKRWEPLLDWLSYEDANLMGVESIAVDPNDANRVYLACGTYTNHETPHGAILASSDRGDTFQRVNVPFKMGGNEVGRGNGERMAVDPLNSDVIYLGTRHDGLWRSNDKGKIWNRVNSFPDVKESEPDTLTSDQLRMWRWFNRGSGIIFVLFDSLNKKNSNIYVGVSLMGRNNLFCSEDKGKTWIPVEGQPIKYRPTHGVISSDGTLYISYGSNPGPGRMLDGAVWKYENGKWTDITPDKPEPEKEKTFGYASVAVDYQNPKVLIASSFGRYNYPGGENIFRSMDGGKSWKEVISGKETFDPSLAPYTKHTGIHWLFDIEIDPFDPDHAMFTTGYGGHETFNLTDADKNKTVNWSVMSTGIEETVALELLSPPKGAHLISAIGDYCGFVHHNVDETEPEGCFINPHFGNTNGVDCAWKNPNIFVRVGRPTRQNPDQSLGYSPDGGKTWHPSATLPKSDARLGHIAVSSDGKSWVWVPEKCDAYVTQDNGTTWKIIDNIPDNTKIISDRVNPQKFYGISLFEGKLFVSTDGGNSFRIESLLLPNGLPKPGKRGDTRGGQDRIYATPGFEGDLWLAAFDGLYHSKDEGKSFSQLKGVEEIHAFGFGKAAPDKNYPALYLVGIVNGIRGIFRSDDTADNWVRINDDQHQWGLILHVAGDPKQYGRVYVGTHGRGIIYGDPKE